MRLQAPWRIKDIKLWLTIANLEAMAITWTAVTASPVLEDVPRNGIEPLLLW